MIRKRHRKCCPCHEKCSASSENIAKVLRRPTQNHVGHVLKDGKMSRSATPATQNDITAYFETFKEERFRSFPHRHCDGTKEASNSRRCMLGHQNEHFVRDIFIINISHFAASKSKFSYEFSYGPQILLPQNPCFVRGFRLFSAHLTKRPTSIAPATQN